MAREGTPRRNITRTSTGLAASGITRGCTTTAYCPSAHVTREQMVTFLYRAEN